MLKEAYAAGVIRDAERWNQILTARNITSHVYDEKTAEEVAAQICKRLPAGAAGPGPALPGRISSARVRNYLPMRI